VVVKAELNLCPCSERALAATVLDECHLPRIARLGQQQSTVQTKQTHVLAGLETAVMAELISQGGRDVRGLGRLVQSVVALLRQPLRTRLGMGLHRPLP
jgi:hypothetical protein